MVVLMIRFKPMLHWPAEPDALYTVVISNLDINNRKNRSVSQSKQKELTRTVLVGYYDIIVTMRRSRVNGLECCLLASSKRASLEQHEHQMAALASPRLDMCEMP